MEPFLTLLKTKAVYHGNEDAVIYDTMHASYNQLLEDAQKKAALLEQFPGKRIVLDGPASYRWLVNFFAILISGKDVLLTNFFLPKEEKLFFLKQLKPDYILSSTTQYILRDADNEPVPNGDGKGFKKKLEFTEPEKEGNVILLLRNADETLRETAFSTELLMQVARKIEANGDFKKDDRVLLLGHLYHRYFLVYGMLLPILTDTVLCIGRGLRHMEFDTFYYHPTILPMIPGLARCLAKEGSFNEELRLLILSEDSDEWLKEKLDALPIEVKIADSVLKEKINIHD